MGFIKTKGIIIREVNTGEADKVVTIFSKSQGKISGFAKGARRPKSRLLAGTQYLCYSDFILYKGKDMFTVSSSDIIEPFYEIRNDIVKLTYSAHMVDLISDVIQEEQPASKVLQLFLNSLHFLTKTDKSPELIVRIFELRLLSLIGYAPHAIACIECGNDELSNISFSFKKCGFLCNRCEEKDLQCVKISLGVAKAIHHIVYSKIDDLFRFELSQGSLEELEKITQRYIKDRLEKNYTKLDFLKTLEI